MILKPSNLDAQIPPKDIFRHYAGKVTARSVTCTKEVFQSLRSQQDDFVSVSSNVFDMFQWGVDCL